MSRDEPGARITADWLQEPALRAVFSALERDGDAVRAVGGAVRNTLLGLKVTDIDLATTALPETVIARATGAGLKVVPTGFDHGTVTVVSDGRAYEVTTLREDVQTHGRHATVRFGRDWRKDAERRDFTMNALYADRDGLVFDPVNGLEDLMARRVRFIGDPAARIREDYLRILRFFRFEAQYGTGSPDAAGLHAAIAARDGLRRLSAERVGQEMRKLVAAPQAAPVIAIMADTGLIEIVVAGVVRSMAFASLRRLDPVAVETREPALGLAALAGFFEEDAARIAERLRLSNAEARRMSLAIRTAAFLEHHLPPARAGKADPLTDQAEKVVQEALYRWGRAPVVDGLLIAWARDGRGPDDDCWTARLTFARKTEVPVFPLAGRDLIAAGMQPGPAIGEALARVEAAWIDRGFAPDKDALLALALRSH